MSFKRVPTVNGIYWISDAAKLRLANPTPFLLMGLVMTLIALIPFLGALVLLIVGPLLYAGIASAARAQAAGEGANGDQLLDGFKIKGRAVPLLALCMPGLTLVGAIGVLAVLVAVGHTVVRVLSVLMVGAGGFGSGPPPEQKPVLVTVFGEVGVVMLALPVLPLTLTAAALLFFAVARVMFDRLEPFSAMRESLRATFANAGAFLVAVITWLFALALIALMLGFSRPQLGGLAAGAVFTPLVGALLYTAWADVFGLPEDRDAAKPSHAAPPSISSGPPPAD